MYNLYSISFPRFHNKNCSVDFHRSYAVFVERSKKNDKQKKETRKEEERKKRTCK